MMSFGFGGFLCFVSVKGEKLTGRKEKRKGEKLGSDQRKEERRGSLPELIAVQLISIEMVAVRWQEGFKDSRYNSLP